MDSSFLGGEQLSLFFYQLILLFQLSVYLFQLSALLFQLSVYTLPAAFSVPRRGKALLDQVTYLN